MNVTYLPWRMAGTYLESCNCEAICPCRRIGGVSGDRSTYGVCVFALSWHVEDGRAGNTDLTELSVVLVGKYDDDAPGSPWTVSLYVDERGDEKQREALSSIMLGRLGGAQLEILPWVCKASTQLLDVRPARIELDHRSERKWFRVADRIELRVSRPVETDKTVTCVIPGHDNLGTELYAELLRIDDPVFKAVFQGNCGFTAKFRYGSEVQAPSM
ncbi:MAG: hypothetical protein A3H97_16305 [Acidobacteria bacterium RIFCSPLOWO2_02_FULL_65_29]|nr:MAG: hypothetical protein A3H97_16305 [Acidobacteria bacterium RIFCSPLOWO2_02_FULL_65_29]